MRMVDSFYHGVDHQMGCKAIYQAVRGALWARDADTLRALLTSPEVRAPLTVVRS
jgi:hypothetical protein